MEQTMKVILTKDECEQILLAHVNQRVVLKEGFNSCKITASYYATEYCVIETTDPYASEATISSEDD
jgi:hypothetical protein